MADINETLAERGKTHGSFSENASVSQGIKALVKRGWEGFGLQLTLGEKHIIASPVILEAVDFIAGKLGRINQNPFEIDHWRDIAGYATLVVKDLEAQTAPATGYNEDEILRRYGGAARPGNIIRS